MCFDDWNVQNTFINLKPKSFLTLCTIVLSHVLSFDQLNASLLNKSINLFKKSIYPKLFNGTFINGMAFHTLMVSKVQRWFNWKGTALVSTFMHFFPWQCNVNIAKKQAPVLTGAQLLFGKLITGWGLNWNHAKYYFSFSTVVTVKLYYLFMLVLTPIPLSDCLYRRCLLWRNSLKSSCPESDLILAHCDP